MQGLLRLAGWGVAATAALLLVVIAANSSSGRERLSAAFAGVNGTRAAEAAKAEAAQAAQLARMAANEDDTRRLIEIVRSLAADRERLMTRLTVLERNLEDVTGCDSEAGSCTPPAAQRRRRAAPRAAAEDSGRSTADGSASRASGGPAPPEPPTRVASITPAGRQHPRTGNDPGTAGSRRRPRRCAQNFDGLRTLWTSIRHRQYGLFEGLHPIVAVRENSKSRTAELRLVAGPLTDVDIACRICTTLAAAKRYCRLTRVRGPAAGVERAPPRRPRGGRQGPPDGYARHPDARIAWSSIAQP